MAVKTEARPPFEGSLWWSNNGQNEFDGHIMVKMRSRDLTDEVARRPLSAGGRRAVWYHYSGQIMVKIGSARCRLAVAWRSKRRPGCPLRDHCGGQIMFKMSLMVK